MSEPEEKPTAKENEDAKEASSGEPAEEEEDLKKLEAEIAKMEEEAARIARETEDLERAKDSKQSSTASAASGGAAAKGSSGDAGGATKRDGLSIYVGQVDYSATPEELLAHFEACGTVERVTIVCDKYSGQPKGYAYLEFTTEEAVENATKLDGSVFKERKLKVTHKRVNDPNFYATAPGQGGGPGRGGRGPPGGGGGPGGPPYFRGGGGGYRGGGRMYRGGFRGGRGPGRGFRGGGRGGYHHGYHPYY